MPQLSILMPVFNERATVEKAVTEVLDAELPVNDFELLVIDDASTDGTRELLVDGSWPPQVRVLTHEWNRGKGAAVRTGIAEAKGTWTVVMDADLEYDAADLGSADPDRHSRARDQGRGGRPTARTAPRLRGAAAEGEASGSPPACDWLAGPAGL
jgi:glycosyltransferase involved in cell wall biosynthesis